MNESNKPFYMHKIKTFNYMQKISLFNFGQELFSLSSTEFCLNRGDEVLRFY
jgi:hypothetical protein